MNRELRIVADDYYQIEYYGDSLLVVDVDNSEQLTRKFREHQAYFGAVCDYYGSNGYQARIVEYYTEPDERDEEYRIYRDDIVVTFPYANSREAAKQYLEILQNILDGNVWGVQLWEDGEQTDSCYGFIGDPKDQVDTMRDHMGVDETVPVLVETGYHMVRVPEFEAL